MGGLVRSAEGGGAAQRWGRRVPVLFLLLSLVVAGFGTLEAFRAQRSHQQTATSLLRDYSELAAWNYERSSMEVLRQAIDAHLAIAYSNPQFAEGHAPRSCLLSILDPPARGPRCDCPPLLAGRYSFFTRLGEPVSESEWVGVLPRSTQQGRVVEAVQAHAREQYQDEWRFALLHVPGGGNAPIVAYTLLESAAIVSEDMVQTRDTVLYGFEIDRQRLGALFSEVLEGELILPPTLTRGRGAGEVINVQVFGPGESHVFESSPEVEMAFAAPIARATQYGGGEIRASVLPGVASELIIGGLPRDRTGTLALIFSLAGALAVLAILQLRREDELALLRQDFVASVSHELRTPLAQVQLFTETLRLGRTQNAEQREWALENIDRETRRLTGLVDNILHFSRSERGVRPVDLEPDDLSWHVREAISSFGPLLPEKKGRLVTEVPDGLVAEIHGDSIRRVILNLLDNAARYGSEGQTIRVAGRRDEDTIRIDVEDEGAGVPVSERERIFEVFRRGERAVGTVAVGSGIGLAVVRQILAAHAGRIWVEDVPGGGARFSFELPALHTAVPGHFEDAEVAASHATGVA